MHVLLIFVLGLIILAGAILLNVIAGSLGLTTWYDFLKNPKDVSVISIIWLFIIYPLGLGLIGYISFNVLFK
jgi:hypothetical protein